MLFRVMVMPSTTSVSVLLEEVSSCPQPFRVKRASWACWEYQLSVPELINVSAEAKVRSKPSMLLAAGRTLSLFDI